MKQISYLCGFLIMLPMFIQAQITILSGVNGGSYQQMANDISRIADTLFIDVQTSNGSTENLNRLIDDPMVDFTFLQEDVLFYQQLKDFEEQTNRLEYVRAVLPLGFEEIHLVAHKNSTINSLADLSGKRVCVGAENSGTSITAKLIAEMTNIEWTTVYLGFDTIVAALNDKAIDAFFFVGATPVARLANLPKLVDFKLVPITDNRLTEIYTKTTIPANTYLWNQEAVETYSGKFLLAVHELNISDVRAKQYNSMFASIKSNFEKLQTEGHPKWKEVTFSYDLLDWQVYMPAKEIFAPTPPLPSFVIISSGVNGGSYHRLALDLQKISDSVQVIESQGSVENLKRIIARDEAYVTFLQYDVLVQQQLRDLEDQTDYSNRIKILLPLANEEVHLITRKSTGILKIDDLKKKKVAIGTVDQGTFVTAMLIKELTNIKWIDVAISIDEAFAALIKNEIDAFFFVGSAPIAKLADVPNQAEFTLVEIEHPKLNNVYDKTIIPSNTYTWLDKDIKTYSVKSVLATNIMGETAGQSQSIKRLLQNINQKSDILIKEGHPKWKDVNFGLDNIKWDIYPESKNIFKN